MIRHEIARVLSAIADRIEPDKPTVEVQYVYVYSAPPIVIPYGQSPWVSSITTSN